MVAQGYRFQQLPLQAYDGLVQADGYWPAAVEPPQRFTLKSQTESIQLESLLKQKFPQLKNRIEGKLNFRGQFEAATKQRLMS